MQIPSGFGASSGPSQRGAEVGSFCVEVFRDAAGRGDIHRNVINENVARSAGVEPDGDVTAFASIVLQESGVFLEIRVFHGHCCHFNKSGDIGRVGHHADGKVFVGLVGLKSGPETDLKVGHRVLCVHFGQNGGFVR